MQNYNKILTKGGKLICFIMRFLKKCLNNKKTEMAL